MPKLDIKMPENQTEPKAQPKLDSFYLDEISDERYLPTDQDKKWLQDLYQRFTDMKTARKDVGGQDMEVIWDNNEKALMSYVEPLPDDDERSNLFIPITHSIVDSILSEWIRQHTSGTVAPSSDPMDAPKAEIVEICRKYIEKKNRIMKVDADTHYDIVGQGNGIQEITYREELREVRVADSVDPNTLVTSYKKKIIKDFDDISIERVPLREFYPAPEATQPDMSDMPDGIRRKIVAYNKFAIEYSDYDNTKYVKKGGEDLIDISWFKKPRDLRSDEVEVLWWWNKTKDFLMIAANGVLLRMSPLPYDDKNLPWVGSFDLERPGQFWKIGEPELLQYIQAELNTSRNIRTDAARFSLLSPIFAPTTSRLETDRITVQPGKIYSYAGQQAPTQFQITGDFQTSFIGEDKLKDDAAYATGVDRQNEGVSVGDETATKVAVRKEATLRRIAKKIYQAQLLLEEKRGNLIISRIMQFYTVPKLELIAGPDKIKEYQTENGEDKNGYVTKTEGDDAGVYKQSYRKIRLENQDIQVKAERDANNKVKNMEVKVVEKKGYRFFNATPELLKGQYDYVVVPDIDIPITKAQEIEISNGLYNLLLANPVIGSPDGKLHLPDGSTVPMPRGLVKATEDLLKVNGRNPADYLPDMDANGATDMDQAAKENIVMAKGVVLGPTPLATPQHSKVHSDFMDANIEDENVRQNFNNHIQGELQFQEQIVNQMGGQNGNIPAPSGNAPTGAVGSPSGV